MLYSLSAYTHSISRATLSPHAFSSRSVTRISQQPELILCKYYLENKQHDHWSLLKKFIISLLTFQIWSASKITLGMTHHQRAKQLHWKWAVYLLQMHCNTGGFYRSIRHRNYLRNEFHAFYLDYQLLQQGFFNKVSLLFTSVTVLCYKTAGSLLQETCISIQDRVWVVVSKQDTIQILLRLRIAKILLSSEIHWISSHNILTLYLGKDV